MKTLQDSQEATEKPLSSSHELQKNQQNNKVTDAPGANSGPLSITTNDGRKVSREDIELVQNLIERCLQLYMNKSEVVKTLLNRARIEPGFTTLVWQKLEEENAEFFRAYYIRLKLKKQIHLFNHLLEHQYHLMTYPSHVPPRLPLVPIPNGIHPMPVNNLPMGYPVLQQQPPIPATGQPHINSLGTGLSKCHIVNGVPAPGNYHPILMNSGNGSVMDHGAGDAPPPAIPPSTISSMSDLAVSPASVASSGHFPFSPSELSGMGIDGPALDTAFTSDVMTSGGLDLGSENGTEATRDSLVSLAQIPWNFSLSDLTSADLTSMGDLGSLENYDGSPFLSSEPDVLLDNPEYNNLVEDFFVDSLPESCSQPDEGKT